MKPIAVSKACIGQKTKRGISIIFFHAGRYTDVIEDFRLGIFVVSNKHNLKISQKILCIFVTLHKKHFESFIWEVL